MAQSTPTWSAKLPAYTSEIAPTPLDNITANVNIHARDEEKATGRGSPRNTNLKCVAFQPLPSAILTGKTDFFWSGGISS